METDLYFDCVSPNFDKTYEKNSLGFAIAKNFDNSPKTICNKYKIVIFGVTDSRKSYSNYENGPDFIREQLYKLKNNFKLPILDLGNLKQGKKPSDTDAAIADITSFCLQNNIIVIQLGGGFELTYSTYLAYEKLKKTVSMVCIDSLLNIKSEKEALNPENFAGKIVMKKSNYLFNYCNIGFQSHYVSEEEKELINKLYFDAFRLGEVRENISAIEPEIRDADMVSINLNSVRHADSPGTSLISPNGFFGEEVCQLAKYAGLSDKNSSFGIYEFCPQKDNSGQTAALAAQIIWYYLEGINQRKGDYPFCSEKEYKSFHVSYDHGKSDIVFYNSLLSNRWWFEVNAKERKLLISCSYEDYLRACDNQLPDKFWKICQKIM
ncbi:MAG: formimidoylglutamase [Bacteroidales bacterium]|nr:formimidoylglutamase [Bacteroidales bacterium]